MASGKPTAPVERFQAALIIRKTLYKMEDLVQVEEIGALEVKGFSHPVAACNVLRLKTPFTPPACEEIAKVAGNPPAV